MKRLRSLSRLLDSSIRIPGGYRIGLDGIIGLVPGIGDVLTTAASGYIILEASRLGASIRILLRMVFNVLLEAVLGIIPILGDLFDFAWKANERNVALLEQHAGSAPVPDETARKRLTIVGVIILLVLLTIVIAIAWLAISGLIALFRAISGGG